MVSVRMKVTILGFAALTSLAAAGMATQTQRATGAKSDRVALDAHRSLGTPHAYRNLTLIPVYDNTARSADTYITLDEGLKSKQVTVKESKDGGDVNTLYVTNDGRKPLYLMGGEVVLGGQQDRTLGKDTIVPSGAKDIPVTVFCVEHGRWTGHKEFEAAAPSVAGRIVRTNAQDGEFYATRETAGAVNGSSGQPVGRSARLPAQIAADAPIRVSGSSRVGAAQQKVWDKVAETNTKLKTQSATGTYRNALTLSSGDAQKSVPAFVTALSGSIGTDPHLVGVVAAVNGKVIAADIFGDPSLFRKLWPKLLRSYAADALENPQPDSPKAPIVTAAHAKAFLITATDAKSRVENKSDVSSTVRYESSEAVTYSLLPAGAAGGGFGGGAVHTGVLGK